MITLATLPQATKQQVFEQGARHMLKQNQKSLRGGECAYRGDGGLSCVGGCFIDEQEYSETMEGISWCFAVAPYEHCDLICDLQTIHDNDEPHQWAGALYRLAIKKGIEWPSDLPIPQETMSE